MSDLISRQDAIDAIKKINAHGNSDRANGLGLAENAIILLPSAEPERLTDDDFETIRIHLNAYKEKLCNQQRWEEADEYQRIIDRFMAFASAEPEPKTGRDCTDFVRWLMDEVMDEENWQMNAVANGEIICRKLKKLGLLDVVDGYYVETQKTGAWIPVSERLPSQSGWYFVTVQGVERVSDMVWYYHESHEWNGVSETQKVLAWMPLPEPYKGGDDE